MAVKLTKRVVEAVLAQPKPQILWDGDLKGFGVKVTPLGRRTYFLYYRTSSGQQRRPTIGVHGAVTADEARLIARRWLLEVANGKDVSAMRRASRQAETVSDLSQRYLAEHAAQHKKQSSVSADRAIIRNHILPLLGSVKLGDVSRSSVENCMKAVKEGKTARRSASEKKRGRKVVRGGPVIANRTAALLSKMFACAEGWGLIAINPARKIRRFKEVRRNRFLTLDEIAQLQCVLHSERIAIHISKFALAAVRLLLMTGMRVGEVRNLRWRNVDFQTESLRLEDTKTGPRVIPMNSHAMKIFQSLPRQTEHHFVFESSRDGSPIALTRPWYKIRDLANISPDANIHSLRHTYASWSVMDGQSLAQVGAVLGHRTAQTTLRYADHRLDEIRAYSQRTGDIFNQRADHAKNGE